MTSSSNKRDLPPNWIVKASRQYPSLSYYANVKTGQSTWKHPSLLKESELKCLTKKKRKKNLQEKSPEKEIPETCSGSDVVKDESKPCKKAKFSPLNDKKLAEYQSSNKQAASESNKQIAEDSTGDHISLKDKEKLNDTHLNQRTLENSQESKKSNEDKPKPIKFIIKNKNVLCKSSVLESLPKKPVKVHSSILLAQKIASREHMKTKIKSQDDRKGILAQDEVQTTKIRGGEEQTSGISESKIKELRNLHDVNKSISESDIKKGKRKESQKKNRKRTSLSTSTSVHEIDKKEILQNTEEQKKDINENTRKEHKMYEDFIKSKSKEWKKSKYKCDASKQEGSFESEVDSEEQHSKSLSENVRPEELKKEALRDDLNLGLPSKEVPLMDGAKVFEPLPESVLADNNNVYPKATDMEVDEEELIAEIANFRGSVSYVGLTLNNSLSVPSSQYSSASIHFVVDTNVLIRDIAFLQQLKLSVVDGRETVVVVPYVALQEMDGLKKSASIGQACQVAVKWCNRHFEAKDSRVLGQTYSNYRTLLEKNKTAVSTCTSYSF